jgi:predicted nucleotidyltransferase
MKGLDEVARELVQLFEAEGIPYALMGGLAIRIHAIPRPTYDVDFTIALSRAALPRLYQQVQELGYTIPAAQLTGWVETVRGLPVVKLQLWIGDRAIDVDVFLAETPYQEHLLTRRRRYRADGFEAWFVSPEDLILLKLLAGRPKDKVDVGDVLFIQGQLDESYLRHWGSQLGISTALEESLRSREAPG